MVGLLSPMTTSIVDRHSGDVGDDERHAYLARVRLNHKPRHRSQVRCQGLLGWHKRVSLFHAEHERLLRRSMEVIVYHRREPPRRRRYEEA